MRKEFLENLFLQRMEILDYQEVFKTSIKLLKSTKLISYVLKRISMELNELKLKSFLIYLSNILRSDSELLFMTQRTDIIRLVFKLPINDVIFDEFYKFILIFKNFEYRILDEDEKNFLMQNFNNFYIYKKITNNYTIDVMPSEELLTNSSRIRFYEMFKDITLQNPDSPILKKYFKSFKDKSIVLNILAIMNLEKSVNESIDNNILLLVDPIKIGISNIDKYTNVLPCYNNIDLGDKRCKICGRSLRNIEKFFVLNKMIIEREFFLKKVEDANLPYLVSHMSEFRTSDSLKRMMKLIFKKAENFKNYLNALSFYKLEDCVDFEDIICDIFAYVKDNKDDEKLIISIMISKKINVTEKIIVNLFIIFYVYYTTSENQFLKLKILNAIQFHKRYFEMYKEKIIGIYLTYFYKKNFGKDIFKDLSEMYMVDFDSFIQKNTFFISTTAYKLECTDNLTLEMIEKGIHFIAAKMIENNEFTADIELFGYTIHELLRRYGVSILVILISRAPEQIKDFERIFKVEMKNFLCKNLSPILFKLRIFYLEKTIRFKYCVFDVIKNIFKIIGKDIYMYINSILPFLEYFYSEQNIKEHCNELGHCSSICKKLLHENLEKTILKDIKSSPHNNFINISKLDITDKKLTQEEFIKNLNAVSQIKSKLLQDKIVAKIAAYWDSFFTKKFMSKSSNKAINNNLINKHDQTSKKNFSIKNGVTPTTLKNIPTKKEPKIKEKEILGIEKEIPARSFCDFLSNSAKSVFIETLNCFVTNLAKNYIDNDVVLRFLGKIGIFGDNVDYTDKIEAQSSYLSIFNLKSICKTLIEDFLINIDNENQDTYFYVIQETLKYIEDKKVLKPSTLNIVEQFYNTKYDMNIEFIPEPGLIYNVNMSYNDFLDSTFRNVLTNLRLKNYEDLYNVLKLGSVLKSSIKKFYVFCGIRKLLEDGLFDHNAINRLISKSRIGNIDKKISKFILECNVFCDYKLLNNVNCIRLCLYDKNYHYLNRILETDLDHQKPDFFLLQLSYFLIKDYDNCKGINDIDNKMNEINIFFELCMEKKFEEAHKLYKLSYNPIAKLDDEFFVKKTLLENHPCTKTSDKNKNFSSSETDKNNSVSDNVSPKDLDLNDNNWILDKERLMWSLLKNTEKKSEINLTDFLECEKSAKKELGEWGNIREVCHLKYDCELIRKSENIEETLKTLQIRRKTSNLNKFLIEKHLEIADYMITNSEQEVEMNEIDNTNQNSKRNLYLSFKESTLLDKVKMYRKQKNFEKCKEEINKMLINQNWGGFYELAKYHMLFNNKIEARKILMKLKSSLQKGDFLFEKSRILEAKLINTKEGYEEAFACLSVSEKLFFNIAKFYEKSDPLTSLEFYIKSLEQGKKYINESLPKIIHLFTNYSEQKEEKNSKTNGQSAYFSNACNRLKLIFDSVDIKYFLPFFNAILSKVNHSDPHVCEMIKDILLKLYEKFPHKTLWPSLIFINSSQKETAKRMKEIVNSIGFDSMLILKHVTELAQTFCKISAHKSKDEPKLSLQKHFKIDLSFKNNVVVPNCDLNIKIVGFLDEIKIYSSLQSPKRIYLVGENGLIYSILCKPNDDLRRDSRFMDLNKMLNFLFRKDEEASKRNLYIRTYNVVPINNKNGIIEWVDDLESLKGIIDPIYKSKGIVISEEQRKHKEKKKIGVDKFEDVLKRHPPVFYNFFNNIKDPYTWYLSKQRFIRTYAVMNIVGWFMGLGDRHLENIMVDTKTCDTFHVDLNCIFDKAKKLEIPEKVPFRLTQNIIHAFGPLKTEGAYRKTMEVVLNVMVKNKDFIMSNLLSFLYDPLHEWRIGKKSVEDSAKILLENLNKKLEIEDVNLAVDTMINEAKSNYNLAMMYIGWCSFI